MARVVVANGAFKSGSTWIYFLARDLTSASPPPRRFLRDDWRNPSVDESELAAFVSWAHRDPFGPYCFKAHFRRERARTVLEEGGALVLNIQRDLRDVLVSAYHHYLRLGDEVGETVEEFYEKEGHRILDGIVNYHQLWSADRPNVYVARYERLLEDPLAEMVPLSRWLGVAAPRARLAHVAERNSFARLRAQEEERSRRQEHFFFRSGVAGGWRSELSEELAHEIAVRNEGLPPDTLEANGHRRALKARR